MLTGLRIHDLQTFLRQPARLGRRIPAIDRQFARRTSPSTTARYAHLHHDPMREATERVGAVIAGAGQPAPAEPTPLRRGR